MKTGFIANVQLDQKSVTLNRTTNTFGALTSKDINITVLGDEADLTAYEIINSNENIVRVVEGTKNSDGTQTITLEATGKTTGKATITVKATDGSNKSTKCTVAVNNPVSGLRIAPAGSNSIYVAKGKSLQLKATMEMGNGVVANKKVEWLLLTSDGEPITTQTDKTLKTGMKISASGKVSAGKKAVTGWYIVGARTKDESKAIAMCLIRVDSPVSSIGLYQVSAAGINVCLENGYGSIPIIAPTMKQGSFAVSSSNPEVMSVGLSSDGTSLEYVTNKKGSVTITIKALDGSGKQVKYKFKVDTDLYNRL